MSETELLEAFRKERSEQAFAELVRRYAGLVYSVAKRRLANAALAEDVTQLVFIRFAKAPPRVRSHAELAAWLHRTSLNVAIDTWRSETRRRTREQQAVVMELTPNPRWEDISPNLDEALNQLNDEDRQVLLLRFFGQKAMREVGAALGVSEDAAKMRVSRAVDRLRTQLGVGGAACTAAALGTLLAEHSLEAAPGPLVSRLTTMRLPVAGATGIGGLLDALLRISNLKVLAGAGALVLLGVSALHLLRASSAPVPESASEPPTHATPRPVEHANRKRFESSGSKASVARPTKPVKIWFHVLDAETGAGLAQTKIHFAFFGSGGEGEGGDILTDNNGEARIPEPDDPSKNRGPNVFVTAEGHVPKVVGFHLRAAPAEYTIRLEPAMTAGGIVVDEAGVPVSGVKILVQGPGNKPGQMENVDFQTCPVSSREDGSWSCSYIPRDYTEIRFILNKPGYAVTFPVVPVGQVNLTNLVLVINRGFTITGQVTDAQLGPVGNAEVRILNRIPSKRQSVKTDEHGYFTMTGVWGDAAPGVSEQTPPIAANAAGRVIIRGQGTIISVDKEGTPAPAGQGLVQVELAVQANGFAAQTAKVGLPNATNVANFTLLPGNIFRGKVVDEAGQPIPNAVVRTDWDFKNQIPTRFEWKARTDLNGRFEWDSAPAEEICYWFDAKGYQVIRGMPLPADGSEHEIVLKSNATK